MRRERFLKLAESYADIEACHLLNVGPRGPRLDEARWDSVRLLKPGKRLRHAHTRGMLVKKLTTLMNRTRAYPDYRYEQWGWTKEGSMSKWYAVAEEASFKPVHGGYIFQSNAFEGDGRNHLVNEAQKAEIKAILQRSRLMIMIFAVLGPPLMAGLGIWLTAAAHAPFWLSLTPIVVFGVVFAFAAIGYRRRKLRPLLAALPITEERITYRERIETIARNLPRAMLGVGLGLGVLAMVLNVSAALYEQPFPFAFIFALSAVVTAYFAWLIVLRLRRVT